MFQYENEINEISTSATSEAALEKMLYKVIDLWNTTPLHLVLHHTEAYSILIISSIDDILVQLEELLRGSRRRGGAGLRAGGSAFATCVSSGTSRGSV